MRVWRGVEANVRQGMTARAVAGVAAVVALGGGCGGGVQHGLSVVGGKSPTTNVPPPAAGGTAGMSGAGTSADPGGAPGPTMSCSPPPPDLPAALDCERGACWISPRPTGDGWKTVAGSSPNDVWVGGFDANVLHFDGTRWSLVPTGRTFVASIWSFSPTDVWIVGDPATVHGDGTTFTEVPFPAGASPTGQAWGAAPDDLYIAGIPLTHWDGTRMTAIPEVPNAFYATGSGSHDVWAGDQQNLYHFDGTAWSPVQGPPVFAMVEIASAGPGRLWALGFQDSAVHVFLFDGTSWSETLLVPADRKVDPAYIAAAPGGQAIFVGVIFDPITGEQRDFAEWWNGNAWTEIALTRPGLLEAAWLDASGDGYMVGDVGAVLHVDDSGQVDHIVTDGPSANLTGVWAQAADNVWLVADDGESFHYDGCQVSPVATGITTPLRDVWGTSDGALWAVGDGGAILRSDQASWRIVPSGTTADLLAVWTAGPGQDVWVGGTQSTLLRITPSGTIVPVAIPGANPSNPTTVTDIQGSGPGDVWIGKGAFGPGGILHNDGTNFIPPGSGAPGTDGPISRVWAFSATDVWVSFSIGQVPETFFRYDGTSWQPISAPFPPQANLFNSPGPFAGGINNSFAFDPTHDLWVGNVGAFLGSQ
ncbi:MAG TPA: hypothetical protein VHG72_01785 [Polyangia bacterium]|nr:hypothetical protein [Polyangia bacterium]